MAQQERSAGVVVFRNPRGAAGREQFLLLDYGRYWDYPKGHVEKGEDNELAARRELREETGIERIDFLPGFKHDINYFFRSKRGLVHKSVVFFLARTSGRKVTLSDEHVGYAWLSYEAALERLKYSSAKAVLRAAETYLRCHEPSKAPA